jgi:hypothetical protein
LPRTQATDRLRPMQLRADITFAVAPFAFFFTF